MTPDEIKARNAELTRSYRQCFGSPAGRKVMADLMAFCRFRVEAADQLDEGKRRVFLRIVNLVNLSDDQLQVVYGGRDVGNLEDET